MSARDAAVRAVAEALDYCGCCGVEMATTTHLDDDYWCGGCRRHVLPPPGWT